MKLYVVSLRDVNRLSSRIIKIFSTKENLDKWMQYAQKMDIELFGPLSRDITQQYEISETELDNLDFIELWAEAKKLGSPVKPIQPQ
jgi:hypothetical protein